MEMIQDLEQDSLRGPPGIRWTGKTIPDRAVSPLPWYSPAPLRGDAWSQVTRGHF